MKKITFLLASIVLIGAGCQGADPYAIDSTELEMDIPIATNSQPEIVTPTDQPSMEKEPEATEFPGVLADEEIQNKQIRITTEKGDIVFELFPDTAPMAVSNFVNLTGQGYYDGLTFHRREEGFVIQGGDPLGNGMGGPGYKFKDELKDDYKYDRGIVAMANSGPNTNGSQFFIMLDDAPGLPKAYTIFGRVTEGMDVVDAIQVGDKMTKVSVEDL